MRPSLLVILLLAAPLGAAGLASAAERGYELTHGYSLPGSSWSSTLLVLHGERPDGGGSGKQTESNGGTTGAFVAYRTGVKVTALVTQERTSINERSDIVVGGLVEDPLLRRVGAQAALRQDTHGPACVQHVEAKISLIADEIRLAPQQPCAARAPWVAASELRSSLLLP